MQTFLHGGRSLTILENLSGRSLITMLENLWRGLYWILKTSLSPKDQRELFVPFSKKRIQHTRGGFRGVSEVSRNHLGFSLDDGYTIFSATRFHEAYTAG